MKSNSYALLALLALGSTSAALAQSSVSLYGRIDASVEQQKYGSAKTTGMASNGSFIGLRAQEDLGGGLKAGFVLESSINADTGSGSNTWGEDDTFNFKRRSEVNLAGNWGMVRMGTFKHASYEATAQAISWHNDNVGSTADSFSNANSHSNVLAYRTPSMAGLSAELQYRFGEKAVWYDDIQYRDGVDLGVRYERGPWGAGFGYAQSTLKGDVHGDKLKDKDYSLRASYDTGTWALGAYYQRSERRDLWPGLEQSHAHSNTLRIAGKYVLGASEFHASIGRKNFSFSSESLNPSQPGSMREKSSMNQWLLAYHYNLSRRTKVYAFYGHQDDVPVTQSFSSLWQAGINGNFRSMGVGMRHQF